MEETGAFADIDDLSGFDLSAFDDLLGLDPYTGAAAANPDPLPLLPNQTQQAVNDLLRSQGLESDPVSICATSRSRLEARLRAEFEKVLQKKLANLSPPRQPVGGKKDLKRVFQDLEQDEEEQRERQEHQRRRAKLQVLGGFRHTAVKNIARATSPSPQAASPPPPSSSPSPSSPAEDDQPPVLELEGGGGGGGGGEKRKKRRKASTAASKSIASMVAAAAGDDYDEEREDASMRQQHARKTSTPATTASSSSSSPAVAARRILLPRRGGGGEEVRKFF
jgi:hypothetical protein